jgi:hypothetical protein
MNITQDEKTKLYEALGLFQNAFRSYLVRLLEENIGDNWSNKFKDSLSPRQLEDWEKALQSNSSPERLVDFQHSY